MVPAVKRLLFGFCLLAISSLAQSLELRPLARGDYGRLVAELPRPAVVMFWALDCAYCREEMQALAPWLRRQRGIALATINTDGAELAAQSAPVIARAGLPAGNAWIFADVPERLRHEVDPAWYGELPRTHLLGRDGSVETVSGTLTRERLQEWWRRQGTVR